MILNLFQELKKYDIPNIIVVCFTGIFWPLVLFMWNRRVVNNIKNLEVSLSFDYEVKVKNKSLQGVIFTFLNNTGSIVYLTNARITKSTNRFKISTDCSKDIAESSYELKFSNEAGVVDKRQITIQTNEKVYTCIGIHSFDGKIKSYSSNYIRKIFKYPKYFCLNYVAMVGEKKYHVLTTF